MNIPRILLSAPKSGSGKTLVTISLLKALVSRNMKVAAFKCGPDYIDPMFHKKVLGINSKNLDPFFCSEEQLKEVFIKDNYCQISVIEGVMGLYDGISSESDYGSTYTVAESLNCPVILVIDGKGMARSIIAEIRGFLFYDKKNLIKGVILNNTSSKVFEVLKPVIEEELKISALGYIPRLKDIKIESRYLGLQLPDEIAGIQEMIKKSAASLEDTVDVNAIKKIASEAAELNLEEKFPSGCFKTEFNNDRKVKVAVAKDEAFCFYYEDNLKLLEESGAELIEFSPLKDSSIPEDVCGLILGGGYPELFASTLSQNESMKDSIRNAFKKGIPLLAECGGFMYLHEKIKTQEENEYSMCGVLPGSCFYTGKLVRFGYVYIQEKKSDFFGTKENAVKGHEFHYFDSTFNGDCCLSSKPVSGKNWESSVVNENQWMGFAHLYYRSNPHFASLFIDKCIKFGEKNGRR